jgi:acyl-CoA synthetase (AMP-forming)/AMP-acid ligase II
MLHPEPARLLQYKGYKQGDVFAIYAPNIIEYVYIFQAVLLIGGVITTANQLYTASELEHQLHLVYYFLLRFLKIVTYIFLRHSKIYINL